MPIIAQLRSVLLTLCTLLLVHAMQALHIKTAAPALHPWLPSRPISFHSIAWAGYVAVSRDNHDSIFSRVQATWTVGDTSPQLSADGRTILSWPRGTALRPGGAADG